MHNIIVKTSKAIENDSKYGNAKVKFQEVVAGLGFFLMG